jgi:hypothetical protein
MTLQKMAARAGLAFASWASCPARGFRPPYGRPTAPPLAARTRAGFPRSARMRPGWDRASSVPRGRRCRHDRVWCPIAACRFATARPCHPDIALRPGMCLSRGISKDSLAFTRPALPSPVAPQTERATLALPLSFPPPDTGCLVAGQGRDRSSTLTRATSPPSASLLYAATHNVRPRVATTGTRSPPPTGPGRRTRAARPATARSTG